MELGRSGQSSEGEVLAELGGDHLYRCYSCGTCASACLVTRVEPDFNQGEVTATARVTDDIRRGVLFMPCHFSESGPNVLTGPSAGPPSMMPEFKFCAARIEALR